MSFGPGLASAPAEATPRTESFTFQEIVTALIRERGLRAGLWSLDVTFGMQATNMKLPSGDLVPGLMAPILKIGLCKAEQPSPITVDAATVNPLALPRYTEKFDS